MKRILSLVLALVIVLGTMPMAFADVEADQTAGEMLQAAGFVEGGENGDLMETKSLTRAELCVLVAELNGVKEMAKAYTMPANFEDVKDADWFASYVAYAVNEGWFNGVGEGKFDPQGEVTPQMLATVMMRALGYTPNWETAISEAAAINLTVDAEGETMNRGEAFVTLWQTVNTPKKDSDVKLGVELGKIEEEKEEVVEDIVVAIDGVKAVANNLVEVEFVEAVDAASAGAAANYTIVEKGDATKELAIVSAVVEGDDVVVLETEAMTAGKGYTVVIGENKANFSGIKKETSAPAVDSVKGTDSGEVEVVFEDALVDKTTAEDVANYSIDKEGTVVAASLNGDRDTVTLTVEGLVSTTSKKLTVENVTSTDGVVMKKVTRSFGPKFDKVAPKLDDVVASKKNNVEVIVDFEDSHGVDKATAEDVANYSIDGLEVLAAKATYQNDKEDDYYDRVILTTSEQTKSKKYVLKVLYMVDGSTAKNATTKVLDEDFRGGDQDDDEPAFGSLTQRNSTEIAVTFTEENALDLATALDAGNYTFKDNAIEVVGVELDDADENGNSYSANFANNGATLTTGNDDDNVTVVLTVTEMEAGDYYKLRINNIADNFGNAMDDEKEKSFKAMTEVKAYSQITKVTCTDLEKVVVTFANDLKEASAEDPTNYVLDGGIGAIKEASLSGNVVTLTVPKLTENKTYQLTVNGVENYWGYAAEDVKFSFKANKDGVDTDQPEVEDVDYSYTGELRITFSEPMSDTASLVISKTAGGALYSTLQCVDTLEDDTVLVFDASFDSNIVTARKDVTTGGGAAKQSITDTDVDTDFHIKSISAKDLAGNSVDYTTDDESFTTEDSVLTATSDDRVSNDSLSQENGNVIHATFDRKVSDPNGAVITARIIKKDGTASNDTMKFTADRDSDDNQTIVLTASSPNKFDDKTWELEFNFGAATDVADGTYRADVAATPADETAYGTKRIFDILGRPVKSEVVTIDVDNDDEAGPSITEIEVVDNKTIKLHFDEKLSTAGSYKIIDLDDDDATIFSATGNLKDKDTTGDVVELDLGTKTLTSDDTYKLSINTSPRDLNGNKVEDEDETFEFVGTDVVPAKNSVTAKINSATEVLITSLDADFPNSSTLTLGATKTTIAGVTGNTLTDNDEVKLTIGKFYALLKENAAGETVTYTVTMAPSDSDYVFQTFTGLIEEEKANASVATTTTTSTAVGDTVVAPSGMFYDIENYDYEVLDSSDSVVASVTQNAAGTAVVMNAGDQLITKNDDGNFVLPVAGDANATVKLIAYPKGESVIEFITEAFTY